MTTTQIPSEALALMQRAKTWPTVSDLAKQTGINGRLLRRAIQDGELPAVRLDYYRVNPEDFAAWFAARQS